MMLRLPRPIEKEARIPFVATTVNKDVGEEESHSILPLYIYVVLQVSIPRNFIEILKFISTTRRLDPLSNSENAFLFERARKESMIRRRRRRGISNPGVSCLPRGARLTCRSSPIKRSQNVGWKERRWSSAGTRKAKGWVEEEGRKEKEKNAKGREREFRIEHTLDHRIERNIFFFKSEKKRRLFRQLHHLDLVVEACHGRPAGHRKCRPILLPQSARHAREDETDHGRKEKRKRRKEEEERTRGREKRERGMRRIFKYRRARARA